MDQQKIKILIADDSAITRGIFEKNFQASGLFEIVGMVSNGRKAIDFCSENDVDLVISDYDMPEMNGIETTKILTKQMGIPVCIYSEDSSVRSQALQEGAMLFEVRPSFSSFTSQSMTPFIEKIAETYTIIRTRNLPIQSMMNRNTQAILHTVTTYFALEHQPVVPLQFKRF